MKVGLANFYVTYRKAQPNVEPMLTFGRQFLFLYHENIKLLLFIVVAIYFNQ